MNTHAYPVRVDASLDSGRLSRWLWLVKWLLVIPHYVVLVFLWLAFMVLSVIAFFAILFTGHYPRSIFDFNVGVMRWTWRVAYYSYSALGTDRYPPFTFAEVPDYPAHLQVEYPDHLSRGLVLVKWWLLAIPHYLVVGLFVGGGAYLGWTVTQDNQPWASSIGLIGVLVLIAAVVLLFTGRYPQQIFDLVLGLNRWVLRVSAYVSLMTDDYPPFRLDMGGDDPGSGHVAVPAPPPGQAAPAASTASGPTAPGAASAQATTPPSGTAPTTAPGTASGSTPGWTAGRVIAVVLGSIVFLVAGGFLAGGTTLLVADQTLRDDDGFFMTDTRALETGTFAIATEPVQTDVGTSADAVPDALIGDVKVEVTSTSDAPVFVGVANADDAAAYLDGVAYATLLGFEGGDTGIAPTYREQAGGEPAVAPGETDIWIAHSEGTGLQTLRWDVGSADWVVVVMNADGSRDVTIDAATGATFPAVGWVVAALFVIGVVLLVVALVLVIGGIASASRARGSAAPAAPAPPSAQTPQE